jgi:Rrf2 family nitric oxide-sensitive transcriptional repressor
MQLTRHTDYALRLLMHLAEGEDGRTSIADVAGEQEISRTHLMKIASELARGGFIAATRGRGGGIRLARAPEEINLGAVVRLMEGHCKLVDCTGCRLARNCRLPGVLDEALDAFLKVLDSHTLGDALRRRKIAA